jgi:hypothetical protein
LGPLPTLLSKVIVPPWASTKRLTAAKPKPCPLGLVVMSGWKIFGYGNYVKKEGSGGRSILASEN